MSTSYQTKFKDLSKVDYEISNGIEFSYLKESGYIEFSKNYYSNQDVYLAIMMKDSIMLIPRLDPLSRIKAGFEGCDIARHRKQDALQTHERVYNSDYVDSLPYVAEGHIPIKEYIQYQANYYRKNNINKRQRNKSVVLEIIISKKGQMQSINICRSLSAKDDELAKNICLNIPQLKPAIKSGKAVAVRLTVPVRLYD